MLASTALFIIAGGQHPPEATELEVKDAVALLPSLTRMSSCQQVAMSQQSGK